MGREDWLYTIIDANLHNALCKMQHIYMYCIVDTREKTPVYQAEKLHLEYKVHVRKYMYV